MAFESTAFRSVGKNRKPPGALFRNVLTAISTEPEASGVEMDDEVKLPSLNWILEKSRAFKRVTGEDVDYQVEPARPPFSYSQIIVHAFIHHNYKKLQLNDVYQFFMDSYCFFRTENRSWRNSVRHLLSLDKRFIKVPRKEGERGKGAFWLLDRSAVEKDGSLKAISVTRQSRRMPAPRAKKAPVVSAETKPHLNPDVKRYLDQMQSPRHESASTSPESVMAVPDDHWHPEESSGTFSIASTSSPPEVQLGDSGYDLHDIENPWDLEDNVFFIDMDHCDLDFASPDMVNELFLRDNVFATCSQDLGF